MTNLKYDATTGNLIYAPSGSLVYGLEGDWWNCDLVKVEAIPSLSTVFVFDHIDGNERHYVNDTSLSCGSLGISQPCNTGGIEIHWDDESPSTELKIDTANKTIWFDFHYSYTRFSVSHWTATANWSAVEPTTASGGTTTCSGTNYRTCEYATIVGGQKEYGDCAHTSLVDTQDAVVSFYFLI